MVPPNLATPYDSPVSAPAPIETARLRLRPMESADEAAMFEYQSDPDVVRFIPWFPRDRERVRESLAQVIAKNRLESEGDYLNYAICLKTTGRLIGQASIHYASQVHGQGEIGYIINPAFASQGYATEAAAKMISLGFDLLDLHRVYAKVDPHNHASLRVLEKLGMRREAHFLGDEYIKGEWVDTLVFGVLDHEWKELRVKWEVQ